MCDVRALWVIQGHSKIMGVWYGSTHQGHRSCDGIYIYIWYADDIVIRVA
jgi:hypothetical protein